MGATACAASDGVGGSLLPPQERGQHSGGTGQQPPPPGPPAALDEGQEYQRDPQAEQPGTGPVEAGPPPGGAHVAGQQLDRERWNCH